MNISVVIATKDRERYIDGALLGLAAQDGAPPFEVVVADNGSNDSTRAVVERHAREGLAVTYVFEPKPNRGKARNRGVAAARGDYLVFCDDDVALPPDWLAAHAAAHAGSDPSVVNGPILNVPSPAQRPKPGPANYSRAFLCTCNASLPAKAFHEVGGFDESFELYGWEDTELGLRLRETGLSWRFAWDAFLWHLKLPVGGDARSAEPQGRRARAYGAPLSRQASVESRSHGDRRASAQRVAGALPPARHVACNLRRAGDERGGARSGSAESRARLFSTEFTRAS